MTTRFSLFDDIKRTDASPRQINEPFFTYLNRSAHREATEIRARLESWFRRFPVEAHDDVRGRFYAEDDRDHRGAIFELFIHELFTRLDCKVKAHPDVPGTSSRPDFLVRHGDFTFYVETKVAALSSSPFARNPLEEDVLAKINSLNSPHFHIFTQVEGRLSSAMSRKQVVQPFIELLAAHDPDEVQRQIDRSGPFAAPSRTIQSGAWSLTGWLEPIAPEKRGDGSSRPLVKGPARTEITDDSTPVRHAILDKANKYGQLDAPLVVAVNVCDPFFDKDDELETLFGKERLVYFEGRPDLLPKLSREPDGVWIRGGYKPRYTRLSAVMMFRDLFPWNLHYVHNCLYVNPFAGDKMKLPEVLYRLSHARAQKNEIRWFEGESIGRILDG